MSAAVGLPFITGALACWVAGFKNNEGEGVEIDVDFAPRPIVEPMSALSMSADFASVRSSLDGLVLACRVQMQAKAVFGVGVKRGGSRASAAVILLALVMSSCGPSRGAVSFCGGTCGCVASPKSSTMCFTPYFRGMFPTEILILL